MTDMLSTPEELLAKPCDQWCELEILSAYRNIKELVAERDALVSVIGAHVAKRVENYYRAEKAEADLADARNALLLTALPFRTNSENLRIERAIEAARKSVEAI